MEFMDKNFDEEVLEEDGPVFVDFLGSWCTACQRMKPIVEKLAGEYDGRMKIGFLNIDKNPQISTRYEVEETPTHVLFEDGEMVERRMGALAQKQIKEILESHLDE